MRREVEGTFGLKYKNSFPFFGSIEPKNNIGRMMQVPYERLTHRW